jgi:hypothetical protein
MDQQGLDKCARDAAMGASRRNVLLRLAGLALGSLVGSRAGPIREAVAQSCRQDLPTAASLQAARAALLGGSTDVDLSPGGCIHLQKQAAATPGGVSREVLTYAGQTVIEWQHAVAQPPPHSPFPMQPFRVVNSLGTRDGDLDGFAEWQQVIQRIVPLSSSVGPLRTAIVTTEFDPATKTPKRRWTRSFDGAGAIHVTVEDAVGGTLKVTEEYDAADVREAADPDFAIKARPGAAAAIAPPFVACPAGLEAEVLNVMAFSAGNGAGCLHGLGLTAEAATIFYNATRPFAISCAEGQLDWKAQIDTATAEDILRPITLHINLGTWADVGLRERTLFHELMHTAMPEDHAKPLLGQMSQSDRDNRWRQLDRVGSCNSLCYNPDATRCECVTCLRKGTCDSPCMSFKDCVASPPAGFCPCDNNPNDNAVKIGWYRTMNECAGECSSGTKCFGIQCIPEQNPCL